MKVSEIRRQFSRLSYERDIRKPPDNRRRGQFRAGWFGTVSEETLKQKLTWHNLGHRMGRHFGSQSDEQIDEVFQILADDYLGGAAPSARKAVPKAARKAGPRRQRDARRKPGNRPQTNYSPDEIDEKSDLPEGAKLRVSVNRYERSPKARKQCIDHYGAKCCICDFSFEDTYGDVAEGFIHVHHVEPVSARKGKRYKVDPIKNLRPVCPNCHAVIHIRKGEPVFSIKEVKAFLRRQEVC